MKIKTGLVMEGGAMRGIFTAGVLDVLMEHGITDFDGAIGISAGACFGINIKSGQHGRTIRYNLRFVKDWRYRSVRSLIRTGDLYGVDFCYYRIPGELDRFDTEAFMKNPMDFYVGCTDLNTGLPVFRKITTGLGEDLEWLRASASMPLVSKPVKIRDWTLLDGGISDSVPLRFMEKKGYARNVVILTQPIEYRKKPQSHMGTVRRLLSGYPAVVHAIETRYRRYNREIAYIRKREQEGDVFVIRPPKPLSISSTEHDPMELIRVYQVGRETMSEESDRLREFLGE
jgi:predicted patatin/cPLA2 family phospholipase